LAKMRLCSKCGVSLDEIRPGVFSCPRGHGEWTTGIVSRPRVHNIKNGSVGGGGPIKATGSKSSGKKRKKPHKVGLINIFDRL
jgi:hypothetical protein